MIYLNIFAETPLKDGPPVSDTNVGLAPDPRTFRKSRFHGHPAHQASFQHGFIVDPTMNLAWEKSNTKAT